MPGVGAVLVVLVAAIGSAALVAALAYNRLVALRLRTENGWSSIDVQLKRRHDLIPNLVETVKAFARHERETFEAVTRARQAAMAASGVRAQAQAEADIGAGLDRLLAVAEAYPDLQASEAFGRLQEELASTENKIAFARQHYNDTVLQYNTAIQSFPTYLMAGGLGFEPREFFEIQVASERHTPAVRL